MNSDSILTSIKKLLGPEEDYTPFDPDIILHINSVFAILAQIGVGPKEGFFITDSKAVWSDFIGERNDLALVKSYVYLRVKLLFDPPQQTALLESMKRQADECESRLSMAAESN